MTPPLLLFFFAVFAVTFFASRLRPDAWSRALAKPPWQPPTGLFMPVWVALDVGVAVAGLLAWSATGGWHPALVLWLAQLLCRAVWPALLFALHRPLAALCAVGLQWLAAVGFCVVVYPLDGIASALFAPYVLWLTFILLLIADLWHRNRYRPLLPLRL